MVLKERDETDFRPTTWKGFRHASMADAPWRITATPDLPISIHLLCHDARKLPVASVSTKPTSTKSTATQSIVCAYIFLAGVRHACAYQSCVHAMHLPACARPTGAQFPLATSCHASFGWIPLRSRIFAYALLGGRENACLIMGVHAHLHCVLYSTGWALISSSDIGVPAWNCIVGYALTFPPTNALHFYPRPQHPPCP